MPNKKFICGVLIFAFGLGETICIVGHHAEPGQVHVLEEPSGPFNFGPGSSTQMQAQQLRHHVLHAEPGEFSLTGIPATFET
jgi:hypothetical protein